MRKNSQSSYRRKKESIAGRKKRTRKRIVQRVASQGPNRPRTSKMKTEKKWERGRPSLQNSGMRKAQTVDHNLLPGDVILQ